MTIEENEMRERIAKFLPRALEVAIGAHKFSSVQKDKDGGAMKKHQEACKAAAAHIELLLKLAQRVGAADVRGEDGQCVESIEDLMAKAQEELSGGSGSRRLPEDQGSKI